MGIFDLSAFQPLKRRADESARAPQQHPDQRVEAKWNAELCSLDLELVPLDGYQAFVAFSPPDQPKQRFFVGEALDARDVWNERVPQALRVLPATHTKNASWTSPIIAAIESGSFGRMRVVEHAGASATYDFFSSTGSVFSWDYIEYDDGIGPQLAAMASPDYDPQTSSVLWCEPLDAKQLLLELSEDEVFTFLDLPDEQASESVKLARRWPHLTHDERREFLPPVELQIEDEVVSLMRAVLHSDSLWDDANFAQKHADFRALWRHPRFCIAAHEEKTRTDLQTNLGFDLKPISPRLNRLWNTIIRYMEARVRLEDFTIPACAARWMRVRGGYILETGAPTQHEHLESRLVLSEFLARHGESLDKLEQP